MSIRDVAFGSLEDIVRAYGESRPDSPMCTMAGETRTYGEADERSNRIAQGLIAIGVGPGDRIALIAKSRSEFFDVLFAVRKAGAVMVPINWRLSSREMSYILGDSGATFVFASAEFIEVAEACRSRAGNIRGVLSLDRLDGHPDYDQWIEKFPNVDPGLESSSEDVAIQLYTSGTTGNPKGVLLANRSLFAFYANAERWISYDPNGVHLNCLPLFHVGGINWSLQGMAQGAHVVGLRDFEPDAALKVIEEYRVTHIMTVPAVIQTLLSRPLAQTIDFSSVKVVIYGGSPISETVLKKAIATFGNVMYGLYGMTEMSFGATLLTPDDHVDPQHPERLRSVGRPFADTELKVVDAMSGEEVAAGEQGELLFRSPQLALGYWNMPDATSENFLSDGFYRTGDIGRQVDGYFYVTDRLKDLIISGGENIFPAEIERVLLEWDEIEDVAVVGVPHDRWGETPRAEVVPRPGADITQDAVLEYLRERLAHYKCPTQISFRGELPRNASGKILRHVLRAELSR